MRKIKNPWVHKEGYFCFGCAPNNPMGIKMEFYEDGDDIVSVWSPSKYYQGWVNTLHGGITSTLLDEVCGWVVSRKLQTTGVTSKLEVHFHKPIMTTDPRVTVRAHLVEMKRNIAFIEGQIINEQGEVCTACKAVYFTFAHEKAVEMGYCGCELEEESGE